MWEPRLETWQMINKWEKTGSEENSAVKRLVRCQYHTKCHDCGQFLKRDRWVPKDHEWKAHGLCKECFELYDSPEY